MNATYETSSPQNFAATPNVISSQASAAGRSLYVKRLGQIIARYGREAVLASLSPRQANAAGLLTSGTCGPTGTGSYSSARLQKFMESRLVQHPFGSTECALTWKHVSLPSGRRIFRLSASVRSTYDTGGDIRLPVPTPICRVCVR